MVVTGNSTLRAYAFGLALPATNGIRIDGTLTVDTNGNTLSILGNVNDKTGGAGALVVDGGGTLNLRGLNNYSLGTTVQGGSVLDVNADNQLGAAGTGVTLNNGTLEIEGTAYTGTARVLALGAGGGTVQIDNGAANFTLASVTGAGALSTFGPGTVELTGANAYTGGTSVAAGVLVIDNGGSLGTGTVSIANAATLRFGNAVTVTNDIFSGSIFGVANLDTNGNNVTLSGAVQGVFSTFNKIGIGTLTLSGFVAGEPQRAVTSMCRRGR